MQYSDISHRPETQQFVMTANGHEAFVTYRLSDNTMYLDHSEVPHQLRGGGVGKELVTKTFDFIKNNMPQYKIVPICSFIRLVAQRKNLIEN